MTGYGKASFKAPTKDLLQCLGKSSNGKNRDWVSLLIYKEVAGEAGRRILAWGNDAKE